MFKLGKKREASEASPGPRRPSHALDEDAQSTGGGDTTNGQQAGLKLPSTDGKRTRTGSFLERVTARPRVDTMPARIPSQERLGPSEHGVPGAPLLVLNGSGGSLNSFGEGASSLGPDDASMDSQRRRNSNASNASASSSGSRMHQPPSLVFQKPSPDGSVMDLPRPIDDGDRAPPPERGRSATLDAQLTPRASSIVPPLPSDDAGVRDFEARRMHRSMTADPYNRNGRSPSRVQPTLNAAPSGAGNSPPLSGPGRKFTVSSVNSVEGKTKDKKGRSGSASSSGIAGALALTGVALASPAPGLSQPKVLKTATPNSTAANGSAAPGGLAYAPGEDVHTALHSNPTSEDGHGAFLDVASQANQEVDYDALMSMETLGNFDEVMEQLGTGYAVASSKRNNDFHNIFSNVPDDDYLIEDYGCALQRDILVQGRIYISEHHLCFNANIFGWVTTLVIPFAEVITIEKKMTALIIPNAIQVVTINARYTFTSFLSRDTAYDLITNIWRISHPNGPSLAALAEAEAAEDDHSGIEDGGGKKKNKAQKKKKGNKGAAAAVEAATGGLDVGNTEAAAAASGLQEPLQPAAGASKGPHAATKCACDGTDAHYKGVALDATFPTTPEKMFNLLYQSGFTKKFWTEDQKLWDIEFGDWAPGDSGNQLLKRNGSYFMPLTAPIGPKSTKCYMTDENIHVDMDSYITNVTTTKTPDVPSGGNFSTMTRTCITWAPKNCCRVLVTTQVEWTKVNRFIKSIVESSSMAGQLKYHAALEAAIRKEIKEHRSEFQDEADGVSFDVDLVDQPDGVAPSESGAAVSIPAEANGSAAGKGAPEEGSLMRQAIDMAMDLAGGAIDTIMEQSPMMLGAGALVLVLLLFNFWTLSSSRAPVHLAAAAAQPGHDGHAHGSAHDVANAVRDVLDHYFAASTGVMQHASAVASSYTVREVTAAEEVEAISRALDGLEQRIAAVREALRPVTALQ